MDVEVIKIIVIGDEAVGKSCILHRFSDDRFSEEYITTNGVDFAVRSMTQTETQKHRKIQVWDTAGQERFRTITSSYYRGGHITFIVYDITNRASFENVKSIWINEVRKYSSEHIKVALVGNKLDLAQKRAVTTDEASEWATEQNIQYTEVSARENLDCGGVEQLFQWATDVMMTPDKRLAHSAVEEGIVWLKKIQPFFESIGPVLTNKNGLKYYEPIIMYTAPGLKKDSVREWIALNAQTFTPQVLTKMTHIVHLNTYDRKNLTAQQAVYLYLLGRATICQNLIDTAILDLLLMKAEEADILLRGVPRLIGDLSVLDLDTAIKELIDILAFRRELEDSSKLRFAELPKYEKQWRDLIGRLYDARDITGDVSVIVEDKVYKAHKLVLIYNCDFFASCLLSNFKEAEQAEIKLDTEVTAAAWECLLQYFYTFDMSHITDTNHCLEILTIAPYLMLTSEAKSSVNHARLLKHCEDTAYNSITDDTALELLLAAHKNEDHVAKEVVIKYIINNYFKLMDAYESELGKLPKPLMFFVLNRVILNVAKK